MTAPDMDVIKDIPGYKVILKAVLKSQIQQLVEQLASHTDEESVILTASVSDGTLSHLGSDSGKNFLDDHEDIKSQFLGFCLKRHHRKKQEKEKEEAMRQMPKTPTRYGGPRPGFMPSRSPRFSSPRHQGIHPVALTRASPGGHIRGMRHEPYPIQRPPKRTTLNFEQNRNPGGPSMGAMRLPLMGNKLDGQVIKIEADEQEDTDTNQSVSDNAQQGPGAQTNVASSSQPSSPSQTPTSAAKVKSESSDKEDDAKSESSSSTIPNETSDLKFSDTAPPEGLSLDSDLSNLISGDASSATDSLNAPAPSSSSTHESHENPGTSGEMDPNINVKVEAITESEMELEITGVELGSSSVGDPMGSQDSWTPGRMGPGATGSQADMSGSEPGYNFQALSAITTRRYSEPLPQQYNPPTGNERFPQSSSGNDGMTMDSPAVASNKGQLQCAVCGRTFSCKSHLDIHYRIHTGEKPFKCSVCGKGFAQRNNMKSHMIVHMNVE